MSSPTYPNGIEDGDNLPTLRRNSARPGLYRRKNNNNSSRSFVDLLPISPNPELISAGMSQCDLMRTIGGDAMSASMRFLDTKSTDHATAMSTRNLHVPTSFGKGVELGLDASSIETGNRKEAETAGDISNYQQVGCWHSFDQDPSAKGQVFLKISHGTIYISNAFLSTSLLYLALVDAGCVDEVTGAPLHSCENKVYGFKPATLITNIAVISGLLAAFFAPVLGAVIDHTPHRRKVGIISGLLLTFVQTIQVYTVLDTWFPMAILQAVAGFLLPIQLMATYAYLPEIARNVGGDTMNHYSKWFQVIGFFTQLLFSGILLSATAIWDLNTIQIAQVGQGISAATLLVTIPYAWIYKNPERPKNKELPEGHSLWFEGFRQNWKTAKVIYKHYSKGLKWFLLANTVADAGVTAFFPIIVTFLIQQLQWGNSEIGLWTIVVLVTAIPGCFIGAKVTALTNPRTSWIISMIYMIIMIVAAALTLTEDRAFLGYVYGGLWGIFWGWYFPVASLIFSMCLPRGSENEMTGLYVYTTLVLQWLPSLIFSIIVETGADVKYGFLSLGIFQVAGTGLMLCMSPWEEVLEEAAKIVKSSDADELESDVEGAGDGDEEEGTDNSTSEEEKAEI